MEQNSQNPSIYNQAIIFCVTINLLVFVHLYEQIVARHQNAFVKEGLLRYSANKLGDLWSHRLYEGLLHCFSWRARNSCKREIKELMDPKIKIRKGFCGKILKVVIQKNIQIQKKIQKSCVFLERMPECAPFSDGSPGLISVCRWPLLHHTAETLPNVMS